MKIDSSLLNEESQEDETLENEVQEINSGAGLIHVKDEKQQLTGGATSITHMKSR
jgi:hypothetical protein